MTGSTLMPFGNQYNETEEDGKEDEAHVKGSEQYSENMVTRTSRTYSSFVSSVAVTSMKMFFVSTEILVASELICGLAVSAKITERRQTGGGGRLGAY